MTTADPSSTSDATGTVDANVSATPARSAPVLSFLLLAATLVLVLLLLLAPRHAERSSLLVIGATVTGGVFVFREQRRARIGVAPVLVAVGVVFAVALSLPPRSSNDVWSYTMYGRMVSVHHVSPYDHVPADFKSDPFQRRVSPIWQHRGSVYGPAFVGYAATVTALAGDSPLVDRLLFQLGAALVIGAVLLLVWRRTRSPAALAWLGLHPLFGAVIVNSGQIDAFVGLAILVAAVLASQRRGAAAGFAIAAASLVKLTGVLALVGIVFWAWRRGERRVARRAVIAAGATMAIVYVPFVAGQANVLSGADHTVTPGSAWNVLAQLLVGKDAGRDLAARLLPDSTLSVLFYVSLAMVGALALLLGWRWARSRVELATGAAAASYTIAAEYTLPWYGAWAMPVLAARRVSPLGWVVWAQAAVLLAAWKLPTHHTGDLLDTVLRGTVAYAVPLLLLGAYAALRPRPADQAADRTVALGVS